MHLSRCGNEGAAGIVKEHLDASDTQEQIRMVWIARK
jgi:hypothetical protein